MNEHTTEHVADHALPLALDSPQSASSRARSRTGCYTCRRRKVKCDEERPVCANCRRGNRTCEWGRSPRRKTRAPRRPNATACDPCREKKLRCVEVEAGNDICERCGVKGIPCIRIRPSLSLDDSNRDPPAAASPSSPHFPYSHTSGSETGHGSPLPPTVPPTVPPIPSLGGTGGTGDFPFVASESPRPEPLSQPPTGRELDNLVQLYFSSVHQFGFFTYIHQPHFNRLLAKGKAPRELTLIMIASAMRFAGEPTPRNLARADAWADAAIGALLSRIYQGFGAVQLMALLLAQNYDLNRGHFTSAWLIGSNCTRMMQMMSLQTFDRTYPPNLISELRLSPLLSAESLRRVAWSAFFIDTIVDGGRYGSHTVDETSFRLQLPCDEASFLTNETCVTEPLFCNQPESPNAANENSGRHLDMTAYLLRTAAVRRRALHFAFRASHGDQTPENLLLELSALEADVQNIITGLPRRFHFNADNVFLHRDRLITFLLLRVLRHNLFIVLGRAALLIYQNDAAHADLISQVRRKRISHALPIAGLVSEGLKACISFDPQIGVHAYVALEILIFEPLRLAQVDQQMNPKAPHFLEAVSHLLIAIRNIAKRSEFVRQLYVEAVYRLLRYEYAHILSEVDVAAFRSEHQQLGEDAAEYDFRDFRWAKLERRRRSLKPPNARLAGDESLLELKSDGDTGAPSAIPSPRLDAMDVSVALAPPSNTQTQLSTTSTQPCQPLQSLSFVETEIDLTQISRSWLQPNDLQNSNDVFSLDWASWLLERGGHSEYASGDFPESIDLDSLG